MIVKMKLALKNMPLYFFVSPKHTKKIELINSKNNHKYTRPFIKVDQNLVGIFNFSKVKIDGNYRN